MHVLLMPIGSAGDVYPYVRLGVDLRDRGHTVTLATSDVFRSLAEAEGFDFVPLASRQEHEEILADSRLWSPRRGSAVFVRNVILPFMRRQYEIIRERVRAGECNVVVAAGQAIGARIAQEKLDIPLATVHLSPFFFRSTYRNRRVPGLVIPDFVPRSWKRALFRAADFAGDWIYGGAVNEFRRELGLPPATAIFWDWWNSPQLILGLFPEWFAPPQPDWPAQTRLTGFPLYDPPGQPPLSSEIDAFLRSGEPPVVITPGTAMAHAGHFFATALKAVQKLQCRAIFLSQFSEQLPTRLPANVAASTYAPFGQLLPRSAAIIHHGGIGTIGQSLAAGIPQLVMPLGFDQPENASRVEELGVGVCVPPRRFRVQRLADELGGILRSEAIRVACRAVAGRIPKSAGLEEGCRAIEQLAGSVPPSGNKRGSIAVGATR